MDRVPSLQGPMRDGTQKIVPAAEIDLVDVFSRVFAGARNNKTRSTPESGTRTKIGRVSADLLNVALQAFLVVTLHKLGKFRVRGRQFDDESPIAELQQRRFRQISCGEVVALTNLFQLALHAFVRDRNRHG